MAHYKNIVYIIIIMMCDEERITHCIQKKVLGVLQVPKKDASSKKTTCCDGSFTSNKYNLYLCAFTYSLYENYQNLIYFVSAYIS